jgi:fibronectin-binding autotransporter adhesin
MLRRNVPAMGRLTRLVNRMRSVATVVCQFGLHVARALPLALLALVPDACADIQAVSIVVGNALLQSQGLTVGWSFTPKANIWVTGLEVFDFNDYNQQIQTLHESHRVAIWSPENTSVPVVSAIVPSGTAAAMLGTSFREVPVTPTLLSANKTYVIGAYYDPSNSDLAACDPDATITYSPVISAGSYRVATSSPGGLAYPGTAGPYRGLYGPSFMFQTLPPSTWAAAVSGNWSTDSNWVGGIPNAVGAAAVINASTTADVTITVDAPQTLGSLLLGNAGFTGTGYNLAGTGSNTLTLDYWGGGATITVTDGAHVISVPTILDDNLTVSGGGSLTIGGVIANRSNAPLGITMVGGGLLVLAGENTYGGNTTISGGTLKLENPVAAQNSTVAMIDSGTLTFAAGNTTPILGGLSGTGKITLSTVASEAVTLAVGKNGQTTTFGGVLSGVGGLTKQGKGALTLAARNTYSGATIIAGGTVSLPSLPIVTGKTISVSGTAKPGSYSLTGSSLTITAAGNDIWGAVQQGYYVYTSVPATKDFDVAVHIASMTAQNTGGWEKAGIMAREDASANYDSAVLVVETGGNGVACQWVDKAQSSQAGTSRGPNWLRMVFNAATHLFTGYESPSASANTPTASDPSWVKINSYTVSMGTAGTFVLGIAATANNNDHTVTAVFDNLGTMKPFLMPGSFPTNYLPATTPLSIESGGTLDLNGGTQQVASLSDVTAESGGSIINSSTAASVLTLCASGGSTTFRGAILGGGTLGSISLTVSGIGTQVLAGSNSFTGGTSVASGTLEIINPAGLPDGSSLTIGANASSIFGGAVGAMPPGNAPAVVPEPSTLALLGMGVVGIAAHEWRRRKRSSQQ